MSPRRKENVWRLEAAHLPSKKVGRASMMMMVIVLLPNAMMEMGRIEFKVSHEATAKHSIMDVKAALWA
jgi:hypothetical protein